MKLDILTDKRIEELQKEAELPVPLGCVPRRPPPEFKNWDEERREDWITGMARALYFAECAYAQDLIDAQAKAEKAKAEAQAKLTLKQVVVWQKEKCKEHLYGNGKLRRDCPECQNTLWLLAGSPMIDKK